MHCPSSIVSNMGNPWVKKSNPYPYPSKPMTCLKGTGFDRYRYQVGWVLQVQKPAGS
jgi:hypothetical protein